MSNIRSDKEAKAGEKTVSRPSTIGAFLVCLFIAIAVYFIARTVFIFYAEYSRLEKALAVVFLLSEVFVMFHAFGYFGAIFRLNRAGQQAHDVEPLRANFPSVAILIPARHEPKEVIESTLISCYNLQYPNYIVYLLDDSSEEKYKQEADEVAGRYGAKVFRRVERHGAKAGIVNDCVRHLEAKYIVIFDADQNPMPTFLSRIIPIMEAKPKLAFVQTPQFYTNAGESKIAFASTLQQAVFYEYICEGKSSARSMICCGTNVVIRREALLDVGGMDESTVTEDFATSFTMHTKGWESLYYNHICAFGMGPEDLGEYFKQQNRWAKGNVGVFTRVFKKMMTSPKSLNLLQWWEYMVTGSYYMMGWAYLILMACPILYLFFNVPSFFMHPVIYAFSFFPYLLLSLAIFYKSMLSRHYGAKHLFKGQLLSFITLPVYMRSSFEGLAGIKGSFQVTAKGGAKTISYAALLPQVIFWAVNLAAITWGLNRYVYEPSAAVMINVLWTAYHCLLLSSVFYFNESD